MTPEEARQLLEGTTPGPWEAESLTYDEPAYPEPIVELQVTAHNGNDVAARSDFDSGAYEPSLNFNLIAAAPEMAAMIANMRTEYTVEYQPNPDSQWHRVSDWSEEYPLIDGEELNPRERIVKRYVTAAQPLGEEQ